MATDMQMLGSREGMGGGAASGDDDGGAGGGYAERSSPQRSAPASRPAGQASKPAPKSSTGFDSMDDDIPF
jgi:single-strand DNA-binding protein